eukprot:g5973.t1
MGKKKVPSPLEKMPEKKQREIAFFWNVRRSAILDSLKHSSKKKSSTSENTKKTFTRQSPMTASAEAGNEFHWDAAVQRTAIGELSLEDHPALDASEGLNSLSVSSFLRENISSLGYTRPTPIQRHAIPLGLAQLDLLCRAQTGSGKTFAFLLPVVSTVIDLNSKCGKTNGKKNTPKAALLARSRQAVTPSVVILAPTRELAVQISIEAQKLSQSLLKVVAIYGGAKPRAQLASLAVGADILVATPGRLDDFITRGIVNMKKVKILVLDEADRMLEMGFEVELRRIVNEREMPPPGIRQTMMFSATFPLAIQEVAKSFLSVNYASLVVLQKNNSNVEFEKKKVENDNTNGVENPESPSLTTNTTVPVTAGTAHTITQRVLLASADRQARLHLLRPIIKSALAVDENEFKKLSATAKAGRTIIFVNTKYEAKWVFGQLVRFVSEEKVKKKEKNRNKKSMEVCVIHGDLTQTQRDSAINKFRSGNARILVATDVAARGLDIPGVAHVVNFSLPRNMETYVHRIGRTGRVGRRGLATSLYVPGWDRKSGNAGIAFSLLRFLQGTNQSIPKWLPELREASYDASSRRNCATTGKSEEEKAFAKELKDEYGIELDECNSSYIQIEEEMEERGKRENRAPAKEKGEYKRGYCSKHQGVKRKRRKAKQLPQEKSVKQQLPQEKNENQRDRKEKKEKKSEFEKEETFFDKQPKHGQLDSLLEKLEERLEGGMDKLGSINSQGYQREKKLKSKLPAKSTKKKRKKTFRDQNPSQLKKAKSLPFKTKKISKPSQKKSVRNKKKEGLFGSFFDKIVNKQ